MSPLWRDEIGIYLAPHKLALTRLARGVKPKSVGEASWVNELEADTHWSNALNALEALLARPEWQGAVARVVVSGSLGALRDGAVLRRAERRRRTAHARAPRIDRHLR